MPLKYEDIIVGKTYRLKPNANIICKAIWNSFYMNPFLGKEFKILNKKTTSYELEGKAFIGIKEGYVVYPEALEEIEPEILFNMNTPEVDSFRKLLQQQIGK